MPEIPQEFIDWFVDYYTQQGRGKFDIYHALAQILASSWQDDEIYQYWASNVDTTGADPTGLVKSAVSEVPDGVPEFPYNDDGTPDTKKIGEILRGLGSIDELNKVLDAWFDAGDITQEVSDELTDTYAPQIDPYTYRGISDEVKKDLSSFTSKEDLADRLSKYGLDKEYAGQLHKDILSGVGTGAMALRGAEGRTLAGQVEAQAERERVQYEGEVRRLQEGQEITALLDRLQRDPANIEALQAVEPLIKTFNEGQYQEGLGEDIYRRLSEIDRGSQREAVRQDLISRETQQIERNMMAMEQQRRDRPAQQAASMLRAFPVPEVGETLERAGLGAGTRLRAFAEQEAQRPSLRQERLDWWRSVLGHFGGTDPQSYAKARQAKLDPARYDPARRLGGEELRKKYFRQPGAGLVGRLTPGVRYR